MRYRVDISYDGSSFHGWQIQPSVRTVQGEVESVLFRVLGTRIRVVGAGRTDAGVHALHQVFHFDFGSRLDLERLFLSLSRSFPQDIALKGIREVGEDFHARFSVRSKTYVYVISRGRKSPFLSRYCWFVDGPLDVDLMKWGAGLIQGDVDFSSFVTSKRELEEKNPVRTIFFSFILERGDFIIYAIKGISFIRYLVRSVVGSLVRLGRERISPDEFQSMVKAKLRLEPIYLAPPSGLFLSRVEY